MSSLVITNTFVANTTILASAFNTNFQDVQNYINDRNSGSSNWDAIHVLSSSIVPFVVDNSSGTSDIAQFKDNGSSILTIADGGAVTISLTAGGSLVPLTIDNNTSTGNIFVAKDGGVSVFSIANGAIITFTGVMKGPAGSVGAPTYSFSSNDDLGMYRSASNQLSFATTGAERLRIASDGIVSIGVDGSAVAPAVAWIANTNIGLFRSATDTLGVVGGACYFLVSGTARAVYPSGDNGDSLGKSGNRWSAVWAANGTIQTSHSSTKTNIQSVKYSDVVIPEPIYFTRPGEDVSRKQLGFAADTLPSECFAFNQDGTRSDKDVYLSSVVGMLCAKIKELDLNIKKVING